MSPTWSWNTSRAASCAASSRRRRSSTVAETVRIMGELLDALDFAHEAGVIHRDVKPANVMLDAQRRVKLADFGVARIQDSERSAAGTMVGTPAFMSPEQIQGLKIDRRTDIFSAGTILYQLLTGDQPFTGAGRLDGGEEDHGGQSAAALVGGEERLAGVRRHRRQGAGEEGRPTGTRAPGNSPPRCAATVAPAQASVPPATPAIPAPKSRAAPQTSDAELEFWRAIQNSTDAAEFEFYLEQFPEGTYARLARHKIARLRKVPDAQDTVRLEAEAQAKLRRGRGKGATARGGGAGEARKQHGESALREKAGGRARAPRGRGARAARGGASGAQRVAEEKAKYDAAEKAKREAEEKARQAAALARLKQQEQAAARARRPRPTRTPRSPCRSSAARRRRRPPMPPAGENEVLRDSGRDRRRGDRRRHCRLPVRRAHAARPAPVAAVAPAKPEAAPRRPSTPDKIRRETEERLRQEFAEKAAAERAALEKSLAEKLAAEAAAAQKVVAGEGRGGEGGRARRRRRCGGGGTGRGGEGVGGKSRGGAGGRAEGGGSGGGGGESGRGQGCRGKSRGGEGGRRPGRGRKGGERKESGGRAGDRGQERPADRQIHGAARTLEILPVRARNRAPAHRRGGLCHRWHLPVGTDQAGDRRRQPAQHPEEGPMHPAAGVGAPGLARR